MDLLRISAGSGGENVHAYYGHTFGAWMELQLYPPPPDFNVALWVSEHQPPETTYIYSSTGLQYMFEVLLLYISTLLHFRGKYFLCVYVWQIYSLQNKKEYFHFWHCILIVFDSISVLLATRGDPRHVDRWILQYKSAYHFKHTAIKQLSPPLTCTI